MQSERNKEKPRQISRIFIIKTCTHFWKCRIHASYKNAHKCWYSSAYLTKPLPILHACLKKTASIADVIIASYLTHYSSSCCHRSVSGNSKMGTINLRSVAIQQIHKIKIIVQMHHYVARSTICCHSKRGICQLSSLWSKHYTNPSLCVHCISLSIQY